MLQTVWPHTSLAPLTRSMHFLPTFLKRVSGISTHLLPDFPCLPVFTD